MKEIYNIREIVKELKINKETIRYYEKIGLLSQPKRDKNGYRVYSKEDIIKVRFILIVKNFGFSLKEIGILLSNKILSGDIESTKCIVDNKIIEINNKINELEDTRKLLGKVNDNILSQNIECCDDMETYLKNYSLTV